MDSNDEITENACVLGTIPWNKFKSEKMKPYAHETEEVRLFHKNRIAKIRIQCRRKKLWIETTKLEEAKNKELRESQASQLTLEVEERNDRLKDQLSQKLSEGANRLKANRGSSQPELSDSEDSEMMADINGIIFRDEQNLQFQCTSATAAAKDSVPTFSIDDVRLLTIKKLMTKLPPRPTRGERKKKKRRDFVPLTDKIRAEFKATFGEGETLLTVEQTVNEETPGQWTFLRKQLCDKYGEKIADRYMDFRHKIGNRDSAKRSKAFGARYALNLKDYTERLREIKSLFRNLTDFPFLPSAPIMPSANHEAGAAIEAKEDLASVCSVCVPVTLQLR
jgi:hypothetical protein